MDKIIAILIECDNVKSLGGSCERDLYNIYQYLVNNKADQSNIYILTNNIPYFTKKNIINNLSNNAVNNIENILKKLNLVNNHNSLFIHISGHGYQINDANKIELDGMSEQIILSSGALIDHQFNSLLKKYIPNNVCLRISVDTCHSGTFSNLCYQIDRNNQKIPAIKSPKSFFINAFSISACTDGQLDSCDIGSVSGFGGGLTSHILENNNLTEFLIGDPKKVKDNLTPILKLLNQEPILLIDL